MVHDGRAGERRGGALGRWEARLEFGLSLCRSQGQRKRGEADGGGCEDISSEHGVRCRSSPAVIHNVTAIFLLQPLLQKKKKKKKSCTCEPPRPR